jgi:ribosome maturation factor RimP
VETSEVIRRAWSEFGPLLGAAGFELIEAETAAMGGQPVLRLYIDREGGVTLDDCVAAAKLVNPVLDTSEWFEGRFMLEMSSPGIDRPLRKPEHFAAFAGERIKLQTLAPVLGRKRFTGVLKGFSDGMVAMACDGQDMLIHIDHVKKASLDR